MGTGNAHLSSEHFVCHKHPYNYIKEAGTLEGLLELTRTVRRNPSFHFKTCSSFSDLPPWPVFPHVSLLCVSRFHEYDGVGWNVA